MKQIDVYIDGACSNNQVKDKSVGGWAFLLKFEEHKVIKSGRVEKTTNSRMELQACIEALKYIKNKTIKTVVYSDSQLVVETINSGWKRHTNLDLWEELDDIRKQYKQLHFVKVKGHSSNQYNNIVDQEAVNQTKR
jgi:ribonuclease HI